MTPDKLITGILLGALLLVIALPAEKKESKKSQDNQSESDKELLTDSAAGQSSDSAYIAALEERLKTTLSRVSGIGNIEVMITLNSTSEAVVNKDVPYTRSSSEETEDGKSRQENSYESKEETVMVETDGDTVPYVVKSIYPQIEGVLVVAQGADNATIKTEIIEAIEVLFGVEPHKVKVLGMD